MASCSTPVELLILLPNAAPESPCASRMGMKGAFLLGRDGSGGRRSRHPMRERHQRPVSPVLQGKVPHSPIALSDAPFAFLRGISWFSSCVFPLDCTTFIVV